MKRTQATGTDAGSPQRKAARTRQTNSVPREIKIIRRMNSLYGPYPSWRLPNLVPCIWPGAARVNTRVLVVRASGGRAPSEQREKPGPPLSVDLRSLRVRASAVLHQPLCAQAREAAAGRRSFRRASGHGAVTDLPALGPSGQAEAGNGKEDPGPSSQASIVVSGVSV